MVYDNLEKFDEKRFDNFTISFFITPGVKGFLDGRKINLIDLNQSEFLGQEEMQLVNLSVKEIGLKFSIVYFGFAMKSRSGAERDLYEDTFNYDKSQVFLEGDFEVSSKGDVFVLKYLLLGEGK